LKKNLTNPSFKVKVVDLKTVRVMADVRDKGIRTDDSIGWGETYETL